MKQLNDWQSDARLYKLTPPLIEDKQRIDYVVVSAIVVAPHTGPETYAFPADENGKASWKQLDCSIYDALDHAGVLHRAGYEIEAGE